ncbi:hypothetical protein CMI37_14975 [Candidatus Pacearchaeota archaeon]|nr:hypothetical protein [Candidatus Pacearchaeota archaeon]
MLRRMVIIADEARAKASDPAGEPQEVAQWLRARLDDVGVNLDTEAVRIALGASELVDTLDAARTASAGRGVPSGMISIDEAAGNFMDGELTILAARPGVGKTALALQIADYTARQMRPVLFVSLEMTNRELVTRVIAAATRLDSRDIRACNLSTDDIKLIRAAKTDLDGVPLSLYSPPRANILDIRAMSRLQHAQDPLRMIVVDYIGLVRPTDWRRPRHEQVSQVSADLKALAKELSVPVLALCQLNREADGARPRLSHLRESGSIEQDADVVMFIHQEKGETELIIAKHRHGETGSVQMNWNPASVRFSDYGRWEPPPPDAEILQDSDRMGDWDRTGDLFE